MQEGGWLCECIDCLISGYHGTLLSFLKGFMYIWASRCVDLQTTAMWAGVLHSFAFGSARTGARCRPSVDRCKTICLGKYYDMTGFTNLSKQCLFVGKTPCVHACCHAKVA